jgi:hypothetical protein
MKLVLSTDFKCLREFDDFSEDTAFLVCDVNSPLEIEEPPSIFDMRGDGDNDDDTDFSSEDMYDEELMN